MKTIKATGKFTVTFNARFGDEEVGESDMYTTDLAGDDVDALVAETISNDSSFPMTFVRDEVADNRIIGRFFGDGDEFPSALMVRTEYM